jgi:hypothetical protein
VSKTRSRTADVDTSWLGSVGLPSNVLRSRSAKRSSQAEPDSKVERALDKVLDEAKLTPKELLDHAIDAFFGLPSGAGSNGLLPVSLGELRCRLTVSS